MSTPVDGTSSSTWYPTFPQNFLQKASHCFSGGVLSSMFVTRIWQTLANRNLDICPSLPEFVYHYATLACRTREYLPSFPWIAEQEIFMIPSVEEAMYSFGVQELLLKQLPKAIIKCLYPSQPSVVSGKKSVKSPPTELSKIDSKTAKVARVFVKAALFSLIHAIHPGYGLPNCSLIRLIQTFAMGIITGTIQEVTGSSALAIAFHAGYNVPGGFARAAMRRPLACFPAIPE